MRASCARSLARGAARVGETAPDINTESPKNIFVIDALRVASDSDAMRTLSRGAPAVATSALRAHPRGVPPSNSFRFTRP